MRRVSETAVQNDHEAPASAFAVAQPLRETGLAPAAGRSPAEEARTLVAQGGLGTLSTLSEDGDPWGSLVAYAEMPDGDPVLLVSTLAEHGRNLPRDGRASLVVAETTAPGTDPLDGGRVTLAGRALPPDGPEEAAVAREAFLRAVPMSKHYVDFGDFALYVLHVDRVRWVGGYGRMDSASAEGYHAAEPDPVAPGAGHAVQHLNDDHADALLDMARGLGGFDDATAATTKRIDRYGIDLWVRTPRGGGPCRIGFAEVCTAPGDLRAATVELAHRARA